jgi:choline-glycine betaine transporter
VIDRKEIVLWARRIRLFVCLPIGNRKLLIAEPTQKNSTGSWLLQILFLQLGILAIFTALTQANIHLLTTANPVVKITLAQLATRYWQNCLLPWPLIILVSLALACFGKEQNRPALLLTAIQPIVGLFANNIIGVGIEIFIRQALQLASWLVFCLVTLFLADITCQSLGLPGFLKATPHAL